MIKILRTDTKSSTKKILIYFAKALWDTVESSNTTSFHYICWWPNQDSTNTLCRSVFFSGQIVCWDVWMPSSPFFKVCVPFCLFLNVFGKARISQSFYFSPSSNIFVSCIKCDFLFLFKERKNISYLYNIVFSNLFHKISLIWFSNKDGFFTYSQYKTWRKC